MVLSEEMEKSDEIEITPEMMWAGEQAYSEWRPSDWAPENVLVAVYTAMARAKVEIKTYRT